MAMRRRPVLDSRVLRRRRARRLCSPFVRHRFEAAKPVGVLDASHFDWMLRSGDPDDAHHYLECFLFLHRVPAVLRAHRSCRRLQDPCEGRRRWKGGCRGRSIVCRPERSHPSEPRLRSPAQDDQGLQALGDSQISGIDNTIKGSVDKCHELQGERRLPHERNLLCDAAPQGLPQSSIPSVIKSLEKQDVNRVAYHKALFGRKGTVIFNDKEHEHCLHTEGTVKIVAAVPRDVESWMKIWAAGAERLKNLALKCPELKGKLHLTVPQYAPKRWQINLSGVRPVLRAYKKKGKKPKACDISCFYEQKRQGINKRLSGLSSDGTSYSAVSEMQIGPSVPEATKTGTTVVAGMRGWGGSLVHNTNLTQASAS